MTNRWIDIIDPVGRELLGRAGDIEARFIIIKLAEAIYKSENDVVASDNDAVATLLHANDYLKDRIGYEIDPRPKGMIRLEVTS